MNNDFNYTPQRPSNTTPTNESPQEPSRPPQVVTSPRKSGAARIFWKILAILFFFALLAAAAYIIHEKHLKPLRADNARLQQQVTGLQESAAAPAAKDEEKPAEKPMSIDQLTILTGSASAVTTTSATVAAIRGDGNVTAIWVESGVDPKSLTTASDKLTNEIGLGAAGTYVEYPVKLSGLKPGTRYFYRAAATVDGKTVYGGVSSFVTAK